MAYDYDEKLRDYVRVVKIIVENNTEKEHEEGESE